MSQVRSQYKNSMRMFRIYYCAIIRIRFITLFLVLKRVTENTVSPLYAHCTEDKVSSKACLLANQCAEEQQTYGVSRWILVRSADFPDYPIMKHFCPPRPKITA